MNEQGLCTILTDIMNPNNHAREVAENDYKILLEGEPDTLISLLLKVILHQSDYNLRTLSGILLKKLIETHWAKLNPETQLNIKSSILTILKNTDHSIYKISSDVIAKLAITLKQSNETWEAFIPFVISSINEDVLKPCILFRLLSETFTFYYEDFISFREKLFQKFSKGFSDSDDEVKASCCICFLTIISTVSSDETQYFSGLIHDLFKSIMLINDSNLLENVLEALRDMAETEPMFFKRKLMWCLELTERLVKGRASVGCKTLILEFCVDLIEKYPKLILAKASISAGVLTLFRLFFEESLNFSLDDIEIDYEKITMELVNRTLAALKGSFAQSIINYIEKSNDDSLKFKYFCILLLSEASVELFDTELFAPLMCHLNNSLMAGEEEIKLACIKTFKKFIKKFGSKFITGYSGLIEDALKVGFLSPNVFVVSAGLELFSEFLKNVGHYQIKPEKKIEYLSYLAKFIFVEVLQEKALVAIDTATMYYKKSVPECFEFFYKGLVSIFYSSNTQVKILTINTLVSLTKTVKKKYLLAYMPEIVSLLLHLSDNNYSSDLYKSCVLENWKALAKYLEKDFTVYLKDIVPTLLVFISADMVDIEEHLETLLVLIESTQENFITYFNIASKLTLDVIINDISDQSRSLSCAIAASLVEIVLKTSNSESKEGVIKYARQFYIAISQVCSSEQDQSTLIDILQSLQRIISAPNMPFLSNLEIELIGDSLIKYLHSQSTSTSLRQIASKMLSTIFKTHTTNTLEVLDFIYTGLINKYLFNASPEKEKIFALSLFGDIVSIVGNHILPEKLEKIVNVVLGNIKSTDQKVKIEAIKSVIQIIKSMNSERFSVFAEGILRVIETAIYSLESRKNDRINFEWAVSAIGFMMHYQESSLKVEMILPWYANFLPLFKVQVAEKSNEIFVDLILSKYQSLVFNSAVLNAMLRISGSLGCGKELFKKIKLFLISTSNRNSAQVLYNCSLEVNHDYLRKILY